ncbi:hypothetical protein D3C75_841240 [compost metagenome]
MKPTALNKLQVVQFSKDVCDNLIRQLGEMHEARWYHRAKINSRPTTQGTTASYDFLGDRQQPKEFNQLLRSLAPVYAGLELTEAIINRYRPGDYMPEHIDVQRYRKNLVIPLCADGDGVEIEGVFYPDVLGEGVCFSEVSTPHAVPPVRSLRYVAIFLYE